MELNINNRIYKTDSLPDENLLGVLRDEHDLTGSKYGCGEGACGACTVLINGTPTRSCITKIGTLAGKKIITIEGVEQNGKLHPVQQACLDVDVFQCSYCAPGMIMSAVALLQRTPSPDDAAIRSAMQGNICRCGTHTRIVDAVKKAIKV
jgi:aerobic-type carbon monoxide dehydrogenase small subunit (CoxS/CutS family)